MPRRRDVNSRLDVLRVYGVGVGPPGACAFCPCAASLPLVQAHADFKRSPTRFSALGRQRGLFALHVFAAVHPDNN
jgi:hypothetical protein